MLFPVSYKFCEQAVFTTYFSHLQYEQNISTSRVVRFIHSNYHSESTHPSFVISRCSKIHVINLLLCNNGSIPCRRIPLCLPEIIIQVRNTDWLPWIQKQWPCIKLPGQVLLVERQVRSFYDRQNKYYNTISIIVLQIKTRMFYGKLQSKNNFESLTIRFNTVNIFSLALNIKNSRCKITTESNCFSRC